MDQKVKLATVWLGGCSGCHMSFLDLDERLIDLAARVQLCASPFMDVKKMGDVDLALVEGAVANEDHLEMLRNVREHAKILVAMGDCAVTGNVTAMRNIFSVEDVLQRAYVDTAAVVVGVPRGGDGVIPRLLPKVVPLHQLVHVDHYLTGCPPGADQIYELVTALLDGRPPRLERRFG